MTTHELARKLLFMDDVPVYTFDADESAPSPIVAQPIIYNLESWTESGYRLCGTADVDYKPLPDTFVVIW